MACISFFLTAFSFAISGRLFFTLLQVLRIGNAFFAKRYAFIQMKTFNKGYFDDFHLIIDAKTILKKRPYVACRLFVEFFIFYDFKCRPTLLRDGVVMQF